MLTNEQRDRILSSIADYDRYIVKEEGRRADLRPMEVQKRLDSYKAQRATLQDLLDNNGDEDDLPFPE